MFGPISLGGHVVRRVVGGVARRAGGSVVGRVARRSGLRPVAHAGKEAAWGLMPFFLGALKVPFGMLLGTIAQKKVKPITDRVFNGIWGPDPMRASGRSSKRRRVGGGSRRGWKRF